MNLLLKTLDKLLNTQNAKSLLLLNQALLAAIPFNRPHGIRVTQLLDESAQGKLPFIRRNKNHLNTVHACGMATLGEYIAGLVLIRNFPVQENRIIMKNLEISFFLQAKEELIGIANFENDKKEQALKHLRENSFCEIPMETSLYNKKNELVALVKTTWHLKTWDKVRYNK